MRYIGIDPGTSGAIAVLSDARQVIDIVDCPVNVVELSGRKTKAGKARNRTVVDIPAMVELLRRLAPPDGSIIALEKVHPMPQEGVVSVWTFASAYYPWIAAAAALGVPLELVQPQEWKKVMLSGSTKEKDAGVIKAQQLFPAAPLIPLRARKADHNRADALLMAEYIRRRYVHGAVAA